MDKHIIKKLVKMYRDDIPLKNISKQLKIKQPLLRYHLDRLGILEAEKDRIIRYINTSDADVAKAAEFLGVKKATARKYMMNMCEMEDLPPDPTLFDSSLLMGPNRTEYNHGYLSNHLNKIGTNPDTIDPDFKKSIIWQMRNLTPRAFARWVKQNIVR